MNPLIIETTNLSFSYAEKQVLCNLNLKVPEKSIFGFLGPNGAGKTTTIKLLLGLLSTNSGSMQLFGKQFSGHRNEILQQIGSLIEIPSVYKHLTAINNLQTANAIYGKNKSRLYEVLEIVGLSAVANKKAGIFSHGMLQRLGIAFALLNDPKLLILDEPTNGLDPNGIIDIRNLLIDLCKNHNKTIFLSSHLLAEMEKLATDVAIIHKGNMLFQGSVNDLNRISANGVYLKTSHITDVVKLLQSANFEVAGIENEMILVKNLNETETAKAIKNIVTAGYDIYSVLPARKSLEDLFLDITSQPNNN